MSSFQPAESACVTLQYEENEDKECKEGQVQGLVDATAEPAIDGTLCLEVAIAIDVNRL